MSSAGTSSPRYAFVTLLTTDSYLPGALVLAHSLRKAHSLANKSSGILTPADISNLGPAGLSSHLDVDKKVDLVCLVTPATVSVKTVKALVRAFDKVVGVEPLSFAGFAAAQVNQGKGKGVGGRSEERKAARKARAQSRKKLALLGRPDLGESAGAALTKLHAWRLTGYDKVVFLDADILVLRPLAHLFSITSSLAASPDIGWPDAFNSGLLVLTPSIATFSDIRNYAIIRGSWDGADQGLLNDYFGGDEASGEAGRGGGWQRLPFRYNVTPNAGYTFTPAYERYGKGIMTAHFIGANKPWNRPKPTNVKSNNSSSSSRSVGDYDALLLQWHQTYEDYYPAATAKLIQSGNASVVHTERGVEVVERPFSVPTYRAVWDAENDIQASGSDLPGSIRSRRGSSRVRGVRPRQSAASLVRGAGQAEDLQAMFQDDVVAASIAAEVANMTTDGNRSTEGIYISLPLDGRISLMGPELDSGAEEDSPDSDETIDAGRWNRGHSVEKSQPGSGSWSPPKVSWDPAREPPPVGGGTSDYQMRIPVDAFYVNAWDQSLQPKGKAAFFEVSNRQTTQPRTMAMLQREHYFDNLGSERPDPSLVKAVFPWEAGHMSSSSSRIFPDEDPVSVIPGSKGLDASLEAGSISPGDASSATSMTGTLEASSSRTTPSAYQTLSPTGTSVKGLPPTLNYTNAWDQAGAIGVKYERRNRSSSNRGIQTLVEDSRASRSSQTGNVKYRNRGSQAEVGHWEEGGPGMNRGPRDASADQSADGDNESSSSSSSSEGGEDSQPSTTKWRREGPGKGYQRKVEKHSEQASPRSPRSQQNVALVGGGGGTGRGSKVMELGRSRSSSGDGLSPHPPVPIGSSTVIGRQRLRADSAQQYVEDGPLSPSLDMSLSTAYEGSYDQLGALQPGLTRYPAPRSNSSRSLPGSARNSGNNTPTDLLTPLNRSPVTSRADLRQTARSQAHESETAIGRRSRLP